MSIPTQPQPEDLPGRIWASFQRDDLPPQDDRGRMRLVMNNLILHLHPAKVPQASLRFTYTWGLGGLATLLTAILAVTGVMLLFVYTPTPESAYNDLLALQTEVPFGQLVRNLHHWSGNLLIVVAFLHLLRVFLTGAFHHPREFNWLLGLSLLLLVVAANFTGYLLPWDQLAYWAITVGTSLISYVPIAGRLLSHIVLGGPEVGAATLTNFYALHIALIPILLFGVLSFHVWRVRKDTITRPPTGDDTVKKVTTIPHLVSREFVFALVMMALILGWATFVNAPLEEAANPVHSPDPAKAAWYFMGLQELLLHFHPFFAAIVIPALGLGALALLPYQASETQGVGVWFRSKRGQALALVGALIGLFWTPTLVIVDEYWLDLPSLMPGLPTIIANGWVPLAALLLALMGYAQALRWLGATRDESRQSVVVLLVTSFLVLTVIGIFFRGPGMALVMPWEVL